MRLTVMFQELQLKDVFKRIIGKLKLCLNQCKFPMRYLVLIHTPFDFVVNALLPGVLDSY